MRVKIRKGDTVEIISGRLVDKGKRGQVIKVLPDDGTIVVQSINMRKKHQKQVQTQGRSMNPGIIEFEGPIAISNVMLVCPRCDDTTRVKLQREDDTSVRVCKKCQSVIDA